MMCGRGTGPVRRRTMKMFETATTMLLAVATQALAIGVIFSF
jgi:hypothetical protein